MMTLIIAGLVGVVFFALTIVNTLPEIVAAVGSDQAPPSSATLFGVVVIQYGGLVILAVWGGLTLARQMDLNPAPMLTRSVTTSPVYPPIFSVLGGFAIGLLSLTLYQWVFFPRIGLPLNLAAEQPLWLRLGNAFFYGGITEELLMRLGLMTACMWVVYKLSSGQINSTALWSINVVIWFLFGLGHLPSAMGLMNASLTPTLVVMALTLNIVSLLFGWIYWHWGIEMAIIAHISFHIGYTLIGGIVTG